MMYEDDDEGFRDKLDDCGWRQDTKWAADDFNMGLNFLILLISKLSSFLVHG